MRLMEDNVLRDMIFEMNVGCVFIMSIILSWKKVKKRERKRECKLLLSERNIALPCWTVSTDYR